jgi:hypothetical protein
MRGIIAVILLNIVIFQADAQDPDTIKVRPIHYFVTEYGVSHASYRDMGVSPLIYSGIFPVLSLGHKTTKPDYIWETKASVSFGNYKKSTGAALYKTNAYGVRLRTDFYKRASADANNMIFFVGTGASYDMSARVSPQYMNAQFVLNNIVNLNLNGRMEFHFTAKPFDKKIWFININKPERNYYLALNLNVPFASIYQYPGYSYVSHATTNEQNEFEDYKWHVLIFPGTAARIEFFKYLINGNALGFAYNFHLFSSRNYLNNYLQMADQSLSFTTFLRLK